jgi:hypothetical protein
MEGCRLEKSDVEHYGLNSPVLNTMMNLWIFLKRIPYINKITTENFCSTKISTIQFITYDYFWLLT